MIYFVLIVKTLTSYGGPRNRESLWRVSSAGNNGGSVGGGGGVVRERERSGDGDQRRGRARERAPKGGRSRRETESARHKERERDDESDRRRNDSEKDGENGKEKASSGLRKVWGLGISVENESTNEVVGAPGSFVDVYLEKEGVSEKVKGSNDG
jgi:hypothetical protein